jgi:hypothetical protein
MLGVDGTLASCTVSNMVAGPPTPLDGSFIVNGAWSSESLPFDSCLDGRRGTEDGGGGVELCTMILGVATEGATPVLVVCDACCCAWARREFAEFLRDLVTVGGGDLSRGDTGQCGVLSPETPASGFCGRGAFRSGP